MTMSKRMPPIKAVMTPFPHVVESADPLSRAGEIMRRHTLRHLPVIDGGRLVGLLCKSDLAAHPSGARRDGRELRVRDLDLPDPLVVELTEPLASVLERMAEQHQDSVIVVKHGKLAGVFTSTDACRCFGEFLREVYPDPHGEDAA